MVGYKHPPQKTQFRKGQSGNPKGRPKKQVPEFGGDRSGNAIALREAERLIKVREGEVIGEMTAIEAVNRAQFKTALTGSAYAQKDVMARYNQAERERRAQIAESCKLWETYVAICRKKIADAAAEGQPLPTPLPHPDDIVIDPETGVRFIGPVDEEDLALMKDQLKMCDVFIMQCARDQHAAREAGGKVLSVRRGTALIYAFYINQLIYERYRLSDQEIGSRVERYAGMTKRSLIRDLYRAWRSVGVPMRRGRIFPPLKAEIIEKYGSEHGRRAHS